LCDRPLIDPAKCDGCGVCAGVCPQSALVVTGGKVNFTMTAGCSWCGECEAVCPSGAIGCPYEIVFG
jgi:MinD superfamily P-loop ATPase